MERLLEPQGTGSLRPVYIIVEGHGDLDAYSNLISRIPGVYPKKPRRSKKGWISCNHQKYRELCSIVARQARNDRGLVLITLDTDKQCIAELKVLIQTNWEHCDVELLIVIADPDFEAWGLASWETLFRSPMFEDCPAARKPPDLSRLGKGQLKTIMRRKYSETLMQVEIARRIDFSRASSRSKSFQRLLTRINRNTP